MSKIVQGAMVVPGVLLFIFILSMIPLVLQSGGDGSLHLNLSLGFNSIKNYMIGIGTGESFLYFSGEKELLFWKQIGGYFSMSFKYVAIGAIIGVTIGILIGIFFAYSRVEWIKRAVEFTGVLPDFVIILLLQLFIVLIYKQTGILVFEVASLSTDEPAVVLPLISMMIIPANYMIRNVAMQMKLTLTEDYILSAKARGMGKTYILFFHALPNVLPFIKADLHKLIGILMGNLFIVEYFYNLRGVTKLLFSESFAPTGYQYDLVVNGLLTLLALYVVIYGLLRVFVLGWEKVFIR
jgi:peptide/nickel transport system permease protein